jgi:hypothetical protein
MVALTVRDGDNQCVPDPRSERATYSSPFRQGAMVVVTLGAPREKFWGVLLSLPAKGVSLCGIELASFDDLVAMVNDGEPFSPGVVFFPMHRVERIELDLPDGNIPSLSQRFTSKTRLQPGEVLKISDGPETPAEAEPQ